MKPAALMTKQRCRVNNENPYEILIIEAAGLRPSMEAWQNTNHGEMSNSIHAASIIMPDPQRVGRIIHAERMP
ncbi:MAG TPA: hypothetical protein VEI74_02845 [Candidatus Methylomirabilis sp.]|nr:hypothetical protein [Candidatus Methylomirabilis sp.]